MFLLVVSGVIGRLLDRRLARVIAEDVSRNGVGIVEALQERLCMLEYTVERLFAGKSQPFRQYCWQALSQNAHSVLPYPQLPPQEQADFQRAGEVLAERTRLLQSLRRQQQARLLMRRWRAVHRMLVCVALGAIGLHLGWLALHMCGTRFHL